MKLKESRASTFSEPSHYVYRENSWNGRRRGRPFASIKVNTDAIKNKKFPFSHAWISFQSRTQLGSHARIHHSDKKKKKKKKNPEPTGALASAFADA